MFEKGEDVGKDIEGPNNADALLTPQKQDIGATTDVQEEIEGYRSAIGNHTLMLLMTSQWSLSPITSRPDTPNTSKAK